MRMLQILKLLCAKVISPSQHLLQAVPHSRITTNDLLNDETFGSTETTGEDTAEEKKRRGSFKWCPDFLVQ